MPIPRRPRSRWRWMQRSRMAASRRATFCWGKEGYRMEGRTITRADLSESVFQEVGLSRNESSDLVETILSEVVEALARGESVKISSFGSFTVRDKGQRVGRNPKTG